LKSKTSAPCAKRISMRFQFFAKKACTNARPRFFLSSCHRTSPSDSFNKRSMMTPSPSRTARDKGVSKGESRLSNESSYEWNYISCGTKKKKQQKQLSESAYTASKKIWIGIQSQQQEHHAKVSWPDSIIEWRSSLLFSQMSPPCDKPFHNVLIIIQYCLIKWRIIAEFCFIYICPYLVRKNDKWISFNSLALGRGKERGKIYQQR